MGKGPKLVRLSRNGLCALVLVLLLAAIVPGLPLSADPVSALILPLKKGTFTVNDVASPKYRDIAYNATTRRYAILDTGSDTIYLVTTTGVLRGQISLGAMGCNDPTGITYNAALDQYAVTDSIDDAVYIVGADGSKLATWDVGQHGATSPTGIAYDSAANRYVICDSATNKLYRLTAEGALIDSCDLSALGITDPEGIAYDAVSGGFGIVNASGGSRVYLVDSAFPPNVQDYFDGANGIGAGGAYLYGLSWTSENNVALVSTDTVYLADISGQLIIGHNVSGWGCGNPTGLAYVPTTQQLAVTDSADKAVYFFDLDGNFDGTISTASFGSTSPTGIAYNPRTKELAIVDSSTGTVYLSDLAGNLKRSFSVAEYGITDANGVGYNYETNEYVITDRYGRVMIFTTTAGLLRRSISTNVSMAQHPTAAVWMMSSGNYAVTDDLADEVFIVNPGGTQVASFDTYNFSATTPTGIDVNLADGTIYLVDAASTAFYILDMPALLPATTPAGIFVGRLSGDGCRLRLETADPEGFLRGTLTAGGISYSTPGYYFEKDRKIVLSLVTDSGTVTYEGVVSRDFSRIAFPSPLGTLRRVKTRSF